MCEVDEVLVEGGEKDRFPWLGTVEVEAEDVVNEEVGLRRKRQIYGKTEGRDGRTVVMMRKMAKSSDLRSDVSWSTPTMMPLSMRTAACENRSVRACTERCVAAPHLAGKSRARSQRSP